MQKWLNWKRTASVIVDSAFKTKTKTSASKQWLSIQSSKFGETSTPGESTNTTSSRNKLQRSLGQKIRIFELSHNFSWQRAFASWCTSWKLEFKYQFKMIKTMPLNKSSLRLYWAVHQSLLWPNTLRCRRFLRLGRSNLLCGQFRMAEFSRVTSHLSRSFCHLMYAQRMPLSYDHDSKLAEWRLLYAHSFGIALIQLCRWLTTRDCVLLDFVFRLDFKLKKFPNKNWFFFFINLCLTVHEMCGFDDILFDFTKDIIDFLFSFDEDL